MDMKRISSIDFTRGLVMIIMALDHTRDLMHLTSISQSPTNLATTTPMLFFTRWITHFCAPVFMLTAGLGAYFWMTRGHHSKGELSRLLISRGIWLIVLEVTILRLIFFSQISFTLNPVILIIFWAIGISMIGLAGLIYLPMRVIAAVSIAIIALHNLLDHVSAERFGRAAWIWDILHQQNVFAFHGINFVTAYPVLPWIGVMALGYSFGSVLKMETSKRHRTLYLLGGGLTLAFIVLRWTNLYGDPQPWQVYPTASTTVMSFLNLQKYPPSLLYLLMTIGPGIMLLPLLEKVKNRAGQWVIVFGRVPMFFYVVHVFVVHAVAVGMAFAAHKPVPWTPLWFFGTIPANFGFPLWVVYVIWIAIIVALYPVCRWYAELKKRRKDWWLGYL